MNRNKIIADCIQKAHYHSERANSSLSNKDFNNKSLMHKVLYSAAFTDGYRRGWLPLGHKSLLNESRRYKTLYEKKAFWRGVNNRQKRDNAIDYLYYQDNNLTPWN